MSDCEEMDLYPRRLDVEKIKRAQTARRWLGMKEMKRRGCEFRLHRLNIGRDYIAFADKANYLPKDLKPNARICFCQFVTCPFHELDAIKKDYIKEYDSKIAKRLDTMTKCLRNMGIKERRNVGARKGVAA